MTQGEAAAPGLRVPPADQCEVNGASGLRFAGRTLTAAKGFTHGTHRTVAPEVTVERLRSCAAAVGITRLADVTGLDRIGIPTVLAHRPNAPTLANAAGKGFTLAAATASAAMEAVEVFHAENLRLPVLHCSYEALAREHHVIPLAALPLTKRSLFRPGRPEHWVIGSDLYSGRDVAVPHGSVSVTPPARRRPSTWMPFAMGTNGLAGGNHLLEAMDAALLEVIERDAIACHTVAAGRNGRPFRRVRLETVGGPLVVELMSRLTEAGIGLVLYDCTADTQVPCYMALIWDRWLRHLGRHRGYGAHLDPHVAILRAITEAVQSRLIYIAGSRDDFFKRDQRAHQAFDDAATVAQLAATPAVVDASEVCSFAGPTFEADIALLLERLRAVGISHVVALDLSHEEIGVPVVRIVAPGLEGYMFDHYRPGVRALRFAAELA